MVRRVSIWVALGFVGCGGDTADDKDVTGPAPTDTDPVDETGFPAHSGTDVDEEPPPPPTGVDEDCWSWAIDIERERLNGQFLTVYLPENLNITHYEVDYTFDGVRNPTYVYDVTYEQSGEDPSSIRYDLEGDGEYDDIREYTYDAMGFRTHLSWDSDGDGDFDVVYSYEYLGGLNTFITVDEGVDGAIDVWFTLTYDDTDRLILVEIDRGNDGVLEEVYTYTFVDPASPDYTEAYDFDADGLPEETTVYQHDPDGRLLLYATEHDDGYFSEWTYTYGDPAPSLDFVLQEGRFGDSDNLFEYVGELTYEAPGKVSRSLYTTYLTDGSEVVNEVVTTWMCP